MSKCLLYGDGDYVETFSGLAGAVAEARTEAPDRPGVRFVVKRDGAEIARYCMVDGRWVEAWIA